MSSNETTYEWEAGELVETASGEIVMSVSERISGGRYRCRWFDNTGHLIEADFAAIELRRLGGTKPPPKTDSFGRPQAWNRVGNDIHAKTAARGNRK